jgi:CBS domain-containing protein
MQAGDVMNRSVVTIASGSTLAAATALLLEHSINAVPVVAASGRVIGVIGIRDVLRAPLSSHDARPILRWDSLEDKARSLATTTVDEVMTRRRIVTVAEDAPIMDVAGIMANEGVHPVLVLHEGWLVGVIGRADIARVLIELSETRLKPEMPPEPFSPNLQDVLA